MAKVRDVRERFRSRQHRQQAQQQHLVQRIANLADLAPVRQILEISKKNDGFLETPGILLCASYHPRRSSPQRSTTDSAHHRFVTYFFTRLPCYYECKQKHCAAYSRSIPRDRLEGEFGALLTEMRPAPTMFALAHDTFPKLWDQRAASTRERKRGLDTEIRKVEQDVEQLVDRVIGTDSATLIKAYESRIRALEERKTELREKMSACGRPAKDFDGTFRTAMTFLENPQKLWASRNYQYQRMVLKTRFRGATRICA